MRPLALVPEYGGVSRLFLSFVHHFFNTRFRYGPAIAEMVRAARNYVQVELFVDSENLPHLEAVLASRDLSLADARIIPLSPETAIPNGWCPLFCRDGRDQGVALTFPWKTEHPRREKSGLDRAEKFGWWMAEHVDLTEHRMPFDFDGSIVAACDEFIFVSGDFLAEDGQEKSEQKLEFLRSLFPSQEVLPVPSLAEEITSDLDTYLLAIGPKVWISSEYPPGTPQAASVQPAQAELRRRGHTVHLVPGLERIRYDDIDTMPNYPNSVLLGDAALVPSYGRPEDSVIQGILKDYGFDVYPIDCRQVVLTSAALHCISKTFPACLER